MDVFSRFNDAFHSILGSGFTRILPSVDYLLWVFLIISIVMLAMAEAMGRTEFLPTLFGWILAVGFAIFVIGDLQNISQAILESMVQLGLRGGGSSISASAFLRSPDAIMFVGLQKFNELYTLAREACSLSSWGCMGSLLVFLPPILAGGVVLITFVLIALAVFATTLLFKLATLASMILLPLLVFQKTAPIGQKALMSMVYFGVQLLVLALITATGSSVFSSLSVGASPGWESSLDVTIGAIVFLGLVFGSGRLAHSLIVGGILSGGTLLAAPAAALAIGGRSAAGHLSGPAQAGASAGVRAVQAGARASVAAIRKR
jgi:type IV secretion system protein TrbL